MNKNDLVSAVADRAGLSKADAAKAVDGVFDSITGATTDIQQQQRQSAITQQRQLAMQQRQSAMQQRQSAMQQEEYRGEQRSELSFSLGGVQSVRVARD